MEDGVADRLGIAEDTRLMAPTLAERVRQRLKDEKTARHITQRDLAAFTNWSQPKVAQKLGGRTPITLDELDTLCTALTLSPTEAVRDRGFEFCAEMTPSEMRLLERYRGLRPDQQQALLTMLGVPALNREARPAPVRKRNR